MANELFPQLKDKKVLCNYRRRVDSDQRKYEPRRAIKLQDSNELTSIIVRGIRGERNISVQTGVPPRVYPT